jgi:hypothetical protein
MTDQERAVLEQALEALEATHYDVGSAEKQRLQAMDAITALRSALAQQGQEPMAWRDPATDDIVSVARRAAWETDYGLGGKGRAATYTEPLYARPPRREWRGLTMQEINALPEIGGVMWRMGTAPAVLRAIRAVERALKEKNS